MSHALLSITGIEPDIEEEEEEFGRLQIINFIKTCPDLTVRPADLSREFGLSINDASAELCGLLQIVGQEASFHFEDINIIGDGRGHGEKKVVKSMIFKFPADFERKVVNAERYDTLKASIKIFVKALKVVTAFGLIVSILIVSVAIVVALVAALVTFSNRGGDSRAIRNNVSRKLRTLINTIRQLLFCYAMFGSLVDDDTGQNDFFREAAFDTLLVMNFCCSNPGSMFFWWRAGRIRQRWRRRASTRGMIGAFRTSHQSNTEDVNLLGEDRNASNAHQSSQVQQRNLISSLVVFLFGTATPTGMSNADKWRLRSAVIISKTTADGGNLRPISLQELAPYTDIPPSSLENTFQVIAQGLSIVAHFNGVPSSNPTTHDEEQSASSALFEFPELYSESNLGVRYDDPRMWRNDTEDTKTRWDDFFYESNNTQSNASHRSSARRTNAIPEYLCEQPKTFTSLSRNQFFSCLLIVVLNFGGVIWFSRSLESGGILEQNLGRLGIALRAGLVPLLWFYARLFLAIPTGRLVFVLVHNKRCKQRNQKRKYIASQLLI